MRPTNVVLDGIDFSVDEGSVCALVGKSGGGKSTLVHLLLRFYDPQAGRISLGGVDYRDLNLASLHKQIGVVSQETQLFNATIQENIAYGTRLGPTADGTPHTAPARHPSSTHASRAIPLLQVQAARVVDHGHLQL